MKVTTEKPEPGVAMLTVEVPPEDFDRAVDGAWRRLANRVNIPGFRRGKAPRPLVERHVGQSAIDEEALRRLLPQQYDAAVEETGLQPIDQPAFNVTQFARGKPVVFTATVPLRPTVELGEYQSITFEPDTASVSDEEIDRVVDRLRESQAQWLPVEDRGVEMADMVIADLSITFPPREDAPDKEGASTDRKDTEIILGENGYPKGFDDQILGLKPGERKEFELTWEMPGAQPAQDEAAKEEGESTGEGDGEGKAEAAEQPAREERRATFVVEVKDVKRKELPAADDALAKTIGEFDSFDAMRADVRRRLYAEALRNARAGTENKAVDAAIEKATFEIPERLLDLETDSLVQERRRTMAEQRITLERYLQVVGQTEADFRAELRPQAERQLKARLVLDELAEREGIEVEPGQIAEEIERTAQQYGEQADEVRRSLGSDEGRRRVSTSLRRHLAIQQLVGYGGGYPADELGVLTGDGSDEAAGSDPAGAGATRDAEGATAAGDADTGVPLPSMQLEASDTGAADVTETVVDAGTGGESASAGGAGGVIER